MISRQEIDDMAATLGVNASNVQRDYVFGWLLAGLYGDSPFADRLVLKGGNAFRKAYFGAIRFSDDLDFAAPGPVDAGQLLAALNEVCRLTQARTDVVFDLDGNRQIGEQAIDKSKTVYKSNIQLLAVCPGQMSGSRDSVSKGSASALTRSLTSLTIGPWEGWSGSSGTGAVSHDQELVRFGQGDGAWGWAV